MNSTKEAMEVEIENKLEKNIDVQGLRNLEKLCKEFLNFRLKHQPS
ncbi:hypothetical protein [Pedobacter sp. V48]|nr:hypothetical protein [Pedobacter sp. V48]ETZ19118.1 hypothetical protein N824_10270 [Pedobacter sp. V48]